VSEPIIYGKKITLPATPEAAAAMRAYDRAIDDALTRLWQRWVRTELDLGQ
jgi:hypothetical protein